LILFVAIVLGGLNVAKVKTLNSSLIAATAARESLERSRAQNDKELKLREAAIAAEQTTLAEREGKAPAGARPVRTRRQDIPQHPHQTDRR
jgi:hypothetical protein